ncbi:MAG TPA: 30S ribosomal protein S4, partial [Calditrichia bacterium]|nr:30S ribosomal protein S4 [Calditrichia bacterium]
DNLIRLLESRLDAVVMRGGLARTIYASRQWVSHGHILVNGKPVNIPSFQVKPGDVVTVKERSKKNTSFQDSVRMASPPAYLLTSKPDLSVTYSELPQREEVPVTCEMSLVVEYYSR